MAKTRGAALVTIITPSLSITDLKTLVTNYSTYTTTGISTAVANCTSTTTSRTITTTTANGFANAVIGMRATGTGIAVDSFIETINSPTSITLTKTPTTATAGTLNLTIASSAIDVITASDQLNDATLRISEMYENNMTQASMSPFGKTKVGSECNIALSIADDRLRLLKLATNAVGYANDAVISMGDQAGLTVGTALLPYRTVIIQPYIGGIATTNPADWYIMPFAGSEASLDLAFGLQTQRSYTLTLTGYDPNESGYRIIRGNPASLP